jgi:hypothetical protein
MADVSMSDAPAAEQQDDQQWDEKQYEEALAHLERLQQQVRLSTTLTHLQS